MKLSRNELDKLIEDFLDKIDKYPTTLSAIQVPYQNKLITLKYASPEE